MKLGSTDLASSPPDRGAGIARSRPEADLKDRRCERAVSAGKRSSAEARDAQGAPYGINYECQFDPKRNVPSK